MAGIKFGFKVKIVQSYERLFDQNFISVLESNNKEASDFWQEFFLLKANPIELEKVLKQQLIGTNNAKLNGDAKQTINYDQIETKNHQIINLLFDRCNFLLVDSNIKLKQLNSILTLYVILVVNAKNSKRTKFNLLSNERIQMLNQNLMNLIDYYSDNKTTDYEVIKLILKLYLCISCNNEDLNENDQIDLLITDRLFDQLFKIICNSRNQNLNYLSLVLITLMQNYNKNHNKNNLFTIRLSQLEQDIALNGYAQVVSKQLLNFNEEYRKNELSQSANQNGAMESILSALSGLLYTNSQQTKTDQQIKFEQVLNSSDNRCALLALYDIIQLNRDFIPFLLTNHSNGEDKETNNLLINFLEFCSINILCLREHFQKSEQLQKKLTSTIRLCFIILTCIVEDQFSLSIMHDSTSANSKVFIHRTKMRHRTISEAMNKISSNRPIAYSILDLLIEFLCSNLRKKHFQIDLYVFSNNIILKLLCYQIKFEVRKEFDWSELFNALFILLKYLTINYDKADELKVKRKSRMLLLANNVVNLFNLFIIFGDTFLHSPDQYDNLYYELLRNHDIFDNLLQLSKYLSVSKKKEEKDAAIKVIDSLDNVESIICHFTGKINESKNDLILTEEEIREIVRNNYDTLSIKVKDGLDIYENYEPEKQLFKKKMLKKIIDQIRANCLVNLDELISDQQIILQSIILSNPF